MMNLTTKRNLRPAMGLALVLALVFFLMIVRPSTSRADGATPAATQAVTSRPTPTFVPVPWASRMTAKPKGDPDEGKLWMPPTEVANQIAKDWGALERNFLSLPDPLITAATFMTYTFVVPTPTPTGLPSPTPVAMGTVWRTYLPIKGTTDFVLFGCTHDGSDCFVRRTWGQVVVGVYDTSSRMVRWETAAEPRSRIFDAELRWDGTRWKIWNLHRTDELLTPTPVATK